MNPTRNLSPEIFGVFLKIAAEILCISAVAGARPEPIDSYEDVRSIRLHAEIAQEERTLRTTVLKKGNERMRSAVRRTSWSSGELTFLYTDAGMYRIGKNREGRTRQAEIHGDAAATTLFDLIGMNPEYHFHLAEVPVENEEIAVFGNYVVRLRRHQPPEEEEPEQKRDAGRDPERNEKEEETPGRPKTLRLYRKDPDNGESLLRSIHYGQFEMFGEDLPQPSLLSYRDHLADTIGEIRVTRLEYNAGIPDFLFRKKRDEANDE